VALTQSQKRANAALGLPDRECLLHRSDRGSRSLNRSVLCSYAICAIFAGRVPQEAGMARRLAAILAADVVGYSRLMAADERGTHARLKALRKDFLEPKTAEHRGRVVKLTGDGALVEFASVVDAVECAAAIQKGVLERQAELPNDRQIAFRIGINIGDIIIEEEDIYGDGVNVAARLEGLAEPGGICVSRNVYNQVKNKVEFGFEPTGEHRVKNIPEPVVVYRVLTEPGLAARTLGLKHAGTRRWRWVALAGLAGSLLSAGGVAVWLQPWRPSTEPPYEAEAPPLPDKPSVAVLPFQNLSDDPEEGYFADGLTDDLITDLSKISGLFVIARNSVFAYKDRAVDVPDVARELGVRYVLEGSVRRAGERVRINAQLIDGSTGGHVWADRYDRDYADIFAVQDQVIEEIVGALSVQLTEAEQTQVTRLPTYSLEAYDYYLRAEQEQHSPVGDVGLLRALGLYEHAISLDGEFADAYAGYARAAAYLWKYSYDDVLAGAVARKRLYEAAGRALALNPELPRARAVLAEAQSLDGEHEEAIESARRAVELGPSDAESHATLASVMAYAGRPAEAVEAAEAALRLDPKPPASALLDIGLALFMDEQYDRAIEALKQARDLAPSLIEPGVLLATAYAQAGWVEQARQEIEMLLQRLPSQSLQFFRLMFAHHRRPEDLARRLDGLRKAGLPEWPYGYPDRPEKRLDGAQVSALTFGQTWQGQHRSGEPFLVQISEDGTTAYRSPTSLRTGMLSLRDNRLCDQSDDFLLGRDNCGYLYHDPKNLEGKKYEYVYVNAFSLMHFSVAD
jgi:adenylate cyclase